jgi:hypothetical protein
MIDSDLRFGRKRERRHERAEEFNQAIGEGETQHTAENREQNAFGKKLSQQTPAPGAQRTADRDFLQSCCAAGERQVGNVGASNQ